MNKMDFKIEKSSSDDVNEIINLYSKYRKNWKPSWSLKERLDEYPALKVVQNEKMIGFAYCFKFAPDIMELSQIYIDQNFRSQNIGATLIGKLEKEVSIEGYVGMIAVNSDAYEGKADSKKPTNFYLNNGYALVAQTDKTTVFFKNLK